MISTVKESLWLQFGASLDMLKNAITMVPDEIWHTRKKFFYMIYHVLIFLDYYLTIPSKKLSSPLPFTLEEVEGNIPADAIDDLVPNRIYSKQELLDYLQANRERCRLLIEGLTEEKMNERWTNEYGKNYPFLEVLLYNMRHVQHHAAQLNLLLRQEINNAPKWVSRAQSESK